MHKYTAELTWRKILFDTITARAQVQYRNHLAWLPVMEGVAESVYKFCSNVENHKESV
jgi:hypothetical protein